MYCAAEETGQWVWSAHHGLVVPNGRDDAPNWRQTRVGESESGQSRPGRRVAKGTECEGV